MLTSVVREGRVVASGRTPVLLQPFRPIIKSDALQVISVLKRNIRDHPTLIMVNLWLLPFTLR
ncbi:hypothetical protein ALT1644_380014 [Alteromonas macleodii]